MDPVWQNTLRAGLLLVTVTMAFAVNPGVKMRLTERGIAYVNTIAENAIRADLQALKISDQYGQDGRLSWSLSNINTQSITGPNSLITLNPEQNGLTWALSNFGIILRADWHVKYKQGWIKISDGGSVTVSLGDVSLTVTAGFGLKNGRPSISSRSCSSGIGHVNVDFHGGTSFIWNLFSGIVQDKIKDILQSRICQIVNKEVNEDAEEALSKMNVYIENHNCFLLDYSLVAPPVVTSKYLELLNKGEVYWKSGQQEAPFSPGDIPALSDVSSMLYLWLTEYSANTYAWVAHNHGYLKYNVTKADLRGKNSEYLNTTCSSTSTCIGSVTKFAIPQISSMYPNSWVELRINSTAVPQVKITSQNITANAWADVDLVVHTPDGTTHYLLTLHVSLALTAEAAIEQEKLVLTIVGHSFDVDVVKSDIGEIKSRNLRIVLEGVLSLVVIPELNKLAKRKPIDLPFTGDIQLLNTKLVLLDGVLLVATDVQYKKSLRFISL